MEPYLTICKEVALFTRAWIEIKSQKVKENRLQVALFTRAWIEIKSQKVKENRLQVALFTRAWIEIVRIDPIKACPVSRPLHEGVD